MNLKIAFLICSSLIIFTTIGQTSNQSYQAPLATQSLLLDIAKSGDNLIAVGERGHILISDDGQDWQQVNTPSLATLTGVYFVGAKGWAVGHDASILMSEDKGKSWVVQNYDPKLERPFLDVIFIDQLHGIAIGAYGTFFRTTDGGQNWHSEMHPEFLHPDDQEYLEEIKLEDEAFYIEELASILPHLNSLSINGDRLYLAGESGLLAYSDDSGKNWQRMEIRYTGSFFDFVETQSGRMFAAGLRGNLFEYNANTEQWLKLESGSQSSLNSVVSVNENTSMVLGNNGAMVTIFPDMISFQQAKDGKALVNALTYGNRVIAVSGVGVKFLEQEL
jgi:photosystem II stability/assembly factor-like uncharacterized protein